MIAEIRKAEAFDVVNIARLLREWVDVAGVHYPEVQDVPLISWVMTTIVSGRVFIAEKSGRIVGVLGVEVETLPWNVDVKILKDTFFYVPKGQRVLGVGDRLMKEAQAMAAEFQVPLLMNIISGTSPDRVDRFYKIAGGVYLGGTLGFGFTPVEDTTVD